MSLRNHPIPGLYNGVSQQPASMRLENQLEEQINAYGNLVDGLGKRPQTEHIKVLTTSLADESSFVHRINRDSSERYLVVLTKDENEPIEVYTLEGIKCTVLYDTATIPEYDPKAYLAAQGEARQSFKALTIADHLHCEHGNDLSDG